MKLKLNELPEGANHLRFESPKAGWLRDILAHLSSQGYQVVGPMAVDINLTKFEPEYVIQGELDFEVKLSSP